MIHMTRWDGEIQLIESDAPACCIVMLRGKFQEKGYKYEFTRCDDCGSKWTRKQADRRVWLRTPSQ